MNKKVLFIIMIIGIVLTIGIAYSYQVQLKNYNNKDFTIKYDSTWKVIDKTNGLKLEHKKSNSIISVQCKKLETNYMDTQLKDIINDVMYSIEQQNKDYVLINILENPTNKYQSYSYLYEKGMEQVLVNVYKQNNKLIIVYYKANSEYFDIVLDSVDTLLDSLDIRK